MENYKIYIIGAGGFGREVLNIYIDSGKENLIAGFLEENCKRRGQIINGKPVDDLSVLNVLKKEEIKLIVAIGTPLRKRICEELQNMGFTFDTAIHPSVIRGRDVEIGEGTVICAGTILTSNIKIGRHTLINIDCTLSHDVVVGDYTTISPGVHIPGKVKIGRECFIGTGTVFVDGVKVGDRVLVGAGSVVTKDLPSDVLAYGVPAKVIRRISLDDWRELI